jgi:hypothetical protein
MIISRMPKILMCSLVLSLSSVFSLPQGLFASDLKDLVAQAQQIENKDNSFKINLSVVDPKSSFQIGDTVAFQFSAEQECYLTLIDIGTSGKVTKMFPNKMNESNKVEAAKTYTIPASDSGFIFKVEGPEGLEYVKAIATLEPLKTINNADTAVKGNFSELLDPVKVFKDIGLELAQQGVQRWTEAGITFNIAAKPSTSVVNEPFKIKVWTDKVEYKEGEPVLVSFESEKDCDLTLLDIGTSGKVNIVFPNQYHQDNLVRAGKVYQIPPEGTGQSFYYRAVGPRGTNTIKAIGTLKPINLNLDTASFKSSVYPELGEKDKVIEDISRELSKLERNNYSEAQVNIEIK